jgi:hypothetical protein
MGGVNLIDCQTGAASDTAAGKLSFRTRSYRRVKGFAGINVAF